jgi:serine/threonine-protein kinase
MSRNLGRLLANRAEIDGSLREWRQPGTVAVVDLVGAAVERGKNATRFTDDLYQVLLPILEKHGGSLLRRTGPAAISFFRDSREAAAAAVEVLQAVELSTDPARQAHVRMALHHGLAYLHGGDVFGDVAEACVRLGRRAASGQILVSQAAWLSLSQPNSGLSFRPVASQGKTADTIYELVWAEPDTYDRFQQTVAMEAGEAIQEDLGTGRYLIVSEVGRGGMGTVYRAYDRIIGRPVALKTIPIEAEPAEYEILVGRLKLEAHAAGMLDHPNIVTVYDVGEEAGLFYFTMQYIEGTTLASLRQENKLLAMDTIFDYADQMCSAISFAHRLNVVHRDLKPSNLMVTPQGVIKVMDFGIAKLGDAGVTKSGMVVGTPSYMAPEQATGKRTDQRADIFALGSVLYELITAEKAFPGESTTAIIYKIVNEDPIPPRALEPGVPAALEAVIMKALSKDPSRRFQSCEDLQRALRQAKASPNPEFAPAKPPATLAVRSSISRYARRPVVLALAAAVVLAVIGLVFLLRPSAHNFKPAANLNPAPAAPAVGTQKAPAQAQAAEVKNEAAPPAASAAERTGKKRKPGDKRAPESNAQKDQNSSLTDENEDRRGELDRPQIERLLAKADELRGNGQYQSAEAYYNQILQSDPNNRDAKEGLHRIREAMAIPANVRR